MSIANRIQAINDHLIDDYKVLRLAGADLTGVNKNILNLKQSWQERLLYFMNNGTDEVWNNWDKVSGTGTTLSINGTVNAPMSLVYKGQTSQTGTPTPSSPVAVNTVSGDNTINVCGKNIIDLSTATKSGWNYVIDNPIKEAGTYTISLTQKSTKPGAVAFRDSLGGSNIGGYFAGYNFGDAILSSTKEITQEQVNAKYIIWLGNGDEPLDELKSIFMLEKSNQATTYEEYKSQSYPISLGDIELCKIGTYQDKIFKNTPNTTDYDSNLEDNVWYLKKEIGKVVLDGSENWSNFTALSGNTISQVRLVNTNSGAREGLSDRFKVEANYNATEHIVFGADYTTLYIHIANSRLSTLDIAGFKAWLSSNNTTLYYILKTPTYETITDTTLLSQLEALKKSYDSQTNISQTNNDLPFELNVTALEVMS